VVGTHGASPVGASQAVVHGFVYKQEDGEAAYWVEYGIGGLGERTGTGWLSAQGREYEPEVTLPCLEPNSEYTYRFAGVNAAGTVYGPERSLITAPGEPAACSPGQGGPAASPPTAAPIPVTVPLKRHRRHRRHRKHRHHRSGPRRGLDVAAPR
jgi:hypothetical protein